MMLMIGNGPFEQDPKSLYLYRIGPALLGTKLSREDLRYLGLMVFSKPSEIEKGSEWLETPKPDL